MKYVCQCKAIYIKASQFITKIISEFQKRFIDKIFGEYIKIALIIICENIMMIHVFSSNNSN